MAEIGNYSQEVATMPSDEHVEYLRISGDAANHVESFIHEIKKNAADGQRYGVTLDVEKIDLPEENEESGFEKASER